MKFPPVLLFAAVLPVLAQENPPSPDENISPISQASTTEVVGDVANGTEPSAPVSAPQLDISPENIRDTTVRTLGDQTLTFQRVEPIELVPPPPEPVPPEPLSNEELAARDAGRPVSKFLFIGANVYSAADAPGKYRTLVQYWPEQDADAVSFWSSANFLFLGGFASFVTGEGENRISYSLMMSATDCHMESFTSAPTKQPLWEIPGNIPEFAPGNATFHVIGGHPTPEQLAPIQALHDLYNSRRAELEAAYLSRTEMAREKEEYLKAHPPEKKNLIFHHWRIDDSGKAQEAAAVQAKEDGQ